MIICASRGAVRNRGWRIYRSSRLDHEERRRQQVRETVDALLGAVSEEDRILLTLKEVEGLSLKELEVIYKVNENALKVRLFRARQRVLKSLGESAKGAV